MGTNTDAIGGTPPRKRENREAIMRHTDESVVGGGGATRAEQAPDAAELLEQRVRILEKQVDTLVLAVRALVEGLERTPGNETGDGGHAVRGARLAHGILLSQGL
ncbi:hypothetical protein ABZ835_43865 [Streptomyces sp. NPDC047461]|uniref:hypothetical protein n=1 Tax=Streptomyces sp. NPDC047461 TaxID=3155619 RepID=UPI00340C60CF